MKIQLADATTRKLKGARVWYVTSSGIKTFIVKNLDMWTLPYTSIFQKECAKCMFLYEPNAKKYFQEQFGHLVTPGDCTDDDSVEAFEKTYRDVFPKIERQCEELCLYEPIQLADERVLVGNFAEHKLYRIEKNKIVSYDVSSVEPDLLGDLVLVYYTRSGGVVTRELFTRRYMKEEFFWLPSKAYQYLSDMKKAQASADMIAHRYAHMHTESGEIETIQFKDACVFIGDIVGDKIYRLRHNEIVTYDILDIYEAPNAGLWVVDYIVSDSTPKRTIFNNNEFETDFFWDQDAASEHLRELMVPKVGDMVVVTDWSHARYADRILGPDISNTEYPFLNGHTIQVFSVVGFGKFGVLSWNHAEGSACMKNVMLYDSVGMKLICTHSRFIKKVGCS